ncbi:rodlin [Streptomyces telluris]|uniref:Rodlin n=1 Tax=Streptomyces telluris TaxID=2720021 RepID=A0A9X2LKD6_9ACTN|nr:rodlin [Streptomyces telluris]MCQ8772462.1 rodlin [Streptomyces telluris]NJP80479.1 RdlA protein [Streptomyces telluris]
MLKKVMAATALTASAVGVIAGPAAAAGDGRGVANANGARTGSGATLTGGYMSPQTTAVQGTLNDLCIGVGKIGVQGVLLNNVGLQDIPVLTSQQQQQCTKASVIDNGDNPLSHFAERISLLNRNGTGNRH